MEIDKIHKRFLLKVEKTETCWNWTGALGNGYGCFSIKNKDMRAHRYSYEYFKGKIPEGLVIDHLCDNKKCVNPDHLRACTQWENILRAGGVTVNNAKKTHCKHGHPFSGKNLMISYCRKPTRVCRACNLRYAIEYGKLHKKRKSRYDTLRYWRKKAEKTSTKCVNKRLLE